MFISVQIRGPAQLVRRRTGEEVDNPIQEFEDGGAHEDGVSAFDLRHRVIDAPPTDLESLEIPTELQVSGSEEQLVAAAAAYSSQSEGQGRDIEQEKEQLRRAELDRPLELRRLLSHMYELSMLARPAKQTFIQHMDNGLAKATLRVWRGALTIGASVQSFHGMASHLARGSSARGAGARLRGEGLLNPDGSINRLRIDVQLDDLPTLGPLEQAELDRLKRTFVRLHADGLDHQHRQQWAEAQQASVSRRPEMPLLLLVAFLTDLERQAFGVLGGRTAGQSTTMMTLHDLLEEVSAEEARSSELDLTDYTRLVWVDDNTPALDVPGCDSDQLDALNGAFQRILAYLPQAWGTRSPQYAN